MEIYLLQANEARNRCGFQECRQPATQFVRLPLDVGIQTGGEDTPFLDVQVRVCDHHLYLLEGVCVDQRGQRR
jgi:hypothetical protein